MTATSQNGVPKILCGWYVACTSAQLRKTPRGCVVHDLPLVLFRDAQGRAHALLDRCPHRNAPLSLGRCVNHGHNRHVECPYHGWQFDGAGSCVHVPALPAKAGAGARTDKGRQVPSYPTCESEGYVFVWPSLDREPALGPWTVPEGVREGHVYFRYQADIPGNLINVAENILDVPHTAFLHRGLFRGGGKPSTIVAVVKRDAQQIEAEYIGEPRPAGVLGSLLAPQGGTLQHFDRFIAPGLAQVEYGLGSRSHILITNLLTPVSASLTRVYTHVALKLPWGLAAPARWLLRPLAQKVVRQDQCMLRELTANAARFGGEQFVSTDVDLLGPGILRLLRSIERGDVLTPKEERVELLA